MNFAIVPFLLLVIPIVEIAAFILIGGQIGVAVTLLLILVTAIIGAALLRHQGMQVLSRIRSDIDASRVPARALGDGAMLVVAGILLLTPGFVTDAIGFLLFVPAVRGALWSFFASRITVMTPGGPFNAGEADRWPPEAPKAEGPVVDLDSAEYSRNDKSDDSPWRAKD